MKFQKTLMTGCRDMDKKHHKCPQNGVSPHLFFVMSIFALHQLRNLGKVTYFYGHKTLYIIVFLYIINTQYKKKKLVHRPFFHEFHSE